MHGMEAVDVRRVVLIVIAVLMAVLLLGGLATLLIQPGS
jgi:hypothetical protein